MRRWMVGARAMLLAGLVGACASEPDREWEEQQTPEIYSRHGFFDRASERHRGADHWLYMAEVQVYQPLEKGKPVGGLEAVTRERDMHINCDWGLFQPVDDKVVVRDERGAKRKATLSDWQDEPFLTGYEGALFDRVCGGPTGRKSPIYVRFKQIVRRSLFAKVAAQGKPVDGLETDDRPMAEDRLKLVAAGIDAANGRALYYDVGSLMYAAGRNFRPDKPIGLARADVYTLVRGADGKARYLSRQSLTFDCHMRLLRATEDGAGIDLKANRRYLTAPHGHWPVKDLPVSSALLDAACSGKPPATGFSSRAEMIADAEQRWGRK